MPATGRGHGQPNPRSFWTWAPSVTSTLGRGITCVSWEQSTWGVGKRQGCACELHLLFLVLTPQPTPQPLSWPAGPLHQSHVIPLKRKVCRLDLALASPHSWLYLGTEEQWSQGHHSPSQGSLRGRSMGAQHNTFTSNGSAHPCLPGPSAGQG